jgi:uracil phosphoribosyltransferase
MAVQVLKARGVPEEHILFLNLIASPEGVKNFSAKFPRLRVVTAFIDEVCHTTSTHHCTHFADLMFLGPRREEV